MAHETFYLFLLPPLKLYQHFIAVRARAFALQVRGILRWFLSEERKSPLLSYEKSFLCCHLVWSRSFSSRLVKSQAIFGTHMIGKGEMLDQLSQQSLQTQGFYKLLI